MAEPLISILIPTYNVENYVNRCIDSVLFQSYKNLEVVVVDDGSTDRTLELLQEYKDERLKVIRSDHGGAARARNKCLDAATGEYIFWLDSDDYITKDTIKICYDLIEREKIDAVRIDFTSDGAGIVIMDEPAYMRLILTDRLKSFLTATLVKRELMDGLRYESGQLIEDYHIYPEICRKIDKLALIRRSDLYIYTYDREGSVTNQTGMKIEGIYPRMVLSEQRYDRFRESFPVECETVLWQFAKYASILGILTCTSEKYKKQYNDARQLLLKHENSIMRNKKCSARLRFEVETICRNSFAKYFLYIAHEAKRWIAGVHKSEVQNPYKNCYR